MADKRVRRRQESWKAADVLCPFYLRDSNSDIECEGHANKMIITLHFSPPAEKNKHMGVLCASRYSECPIYQNTMRIKYPD